jgi:hypothetical protein
VQMGSAHCASQAGPARGSRPTWPFSPRPKSRGAHLALARGHAGLAATRPSRRCPWRGLARRGLGGPGQHGGLIWGIGREGGSPGVAVHGDGFWPEGNDDGDSVWWSGWLASGLGSIRRTTRSSRRWRLGRRRARGGGSRGSGWTLGCWREAHRCHRGAMESRGTAWHGPARCSVMHVGSSARQLGTGRQHGAEAR